MPYSNDPPCLNEMHFDDDVEYEDLFDVISFEGFRFDKWYEGEKDLLKPRLEKAGYSEVQFTMGERDSFGPLSRICKATKDGKTHSFVYG